MTLFTCQGVGSEVTPQTRVLHFLSAMLLVENMRAIRAISPAQIESGLSM